MPTAAPMILAAVASSVVSHLLAPKPPSPAEAPAAPPVVAPPVTMPDASSNDVEAAKQNSIREQQARAGRASTVLTADSGGDKLGS